MKISMMTYSLARLGHVTDPFEMVRLTVDLGMEGIDWVTTYDHDPKELRTMCDDHGVPVVAHTYMVHEVIASDPAEQERGFDAHKRGLEAAVILGAPVVMFPTPGGEDLDRGEARRRWIHALKRMAPLAEDAGVVLSIENFPGEDSPFVTASDFREAQAEVPSLRLTYDNGNAASGEDEVESLRGTFDSVVHVHFKDFYIRNDAAEGYRPMLDGRFFKPALIGEGGVDTASCWQTLAELGYTGYVNVEYEGDEYPAREAVRRAVDYLRAL